MRLGCVFKIRSLHDRIHRTCFLTESAEDTFGHIDIVLCRTTTSVRPGFGVDRNRLSWACCLAQFASDTTFLAARVTSKCVFTTKSRGNCALFQRVVDCQIWSPPMLDTHPYSTHYIRQEDHFRRFVHHCRLTYVNVENIDRRRTELHVRARNVLSLRDVFSGAGPAYFDSRLSFSALFSRRSFRIYASVFRQRTPIISLSLLRTSNSHNGSL